MVVQHAAGQSIAGLQQRVEQDLERRGVATLGLLDERHGGLVHDHPYPLYAWIWLVSGRNSEQSARGTADERKNSQVRQFWIGRGPGAWVLTVPKSERVRPPRPFSRVLRSILDAGRAAFSPVSATQLTVADDTHCLLQIG
jgi:hypothetical protein